MTINPTTGWSSTMERDGKRMRRPRRQRSRDSLRGRGTTGLIVCVQAPSLLHCTSTCRGLVSFDKPLSLTIQKSPKVSGRLCSSQRIQPSHHQRTRSKPTPQLSSSVHTDRPPIRQCHQCRPRRLRCFERRRSLAGRYAAHRAHDCQWSTGKHCRQLSTAW